MIKPEELRIGNLFFRGENVVEIKGIHTQTYGQTHDRDVHCYVRDLANGNMSYTATHLDELTPISLNEEWLLKLRFDKIENHEALFWQKGYLRVYMDLFFDKTFNCCKREPSNPQADNFICSVKSVHELQNIYFALTAEELKIK